MSYTEFSGYGEYALCTIIHREAFSKAISFLVEQGPKLGIEPWSDEVIDAPWRRCGSNDCLHRLQDLEKGKEDFVYLGWNPRKVEDTVKSISQLFFALRVIDEQQFPLFDCLENAALQVTVSYTSGGYAVRADFTPAVWNVIEEGHFEKALLPAINQDLRRWFEEGDNCSKPGQYGTVFDGKNGLTLSFYQPTGNGLWIAGSRSSMDQVHQLTDHNTDHAIEALGHIIALCIVLKHCRQYLMQK